MWFLHNWKQADNKNPRTLIKVWKLAGSAKYKQSEKVFVYKVCLGRKRKIFLVWLKCIQQNYEGTFNITF